MSDKIKPHHLARKALLYVRQSSPHQVLHNRESQALQYAMRDRLVALGWSEVDTVDDDLGRSAAGGVTRVGFERMVAEVCLGKVGAVAAREVSRFARNSRDWQQLIEMCRVVDTVLIDQEMVYAPRQGNDRLLLGLKGSLNEYELDLLRQRSLSARYEKARRGELIVAAPVGFVKVGDHLESTTISIGAIWTPSRSLVMPRSLSAKSSASILMPEPASARSCGACADGRAASTAFCTRKSVTWLPASTSPRASSQ
jgi:DNA invertase Pin-like site-specific DNA recombinase